VTQRDDDINLETHEFVGKSWEPFPLPLRRSNLEHDVLSIDIAQLAESLAKRGDTRGRGGRQEPYSEGLSCLRLPRDGCAETQYGHDGGEPGDRRSHNRSSPVDRSAARQAMRWTDQVPSPQGAQLSAQRCGERRAKRVRFTAELCCPRRPRHAEACRRF